MKRINKKNISFVAASGLCLKCGICYSICPENAIYIDSKREIDLIVNDFCINCSKCLQVCPGLKPIISRNKAETLLGPVKSCYIGYSSDEDIRKSAASGGIITSLNLFLLNKCNYDGIICIRQSRNNIYENEVILATSDKDIISAKGSRYSPAYVCRALKDLSLEKSKKYAIVGKPCDIQAILKYQNINKKYNFFKIALFCAQVPKISAIKEVIGINNIEENNIKEINYRGHGWPGWFTVVSKSNEIIFKREYLDIWNNTLSKSKYINKRCFLCHDCTGEFADISAGDAWLDEYINKSIGHSIVITRSTIAEKYIQAIIKEKILTLDKVDESIVIRSQRNLLTKKSNIFFKRLVAKLLLEKIPDEKISFEFVTNHFKDIPGFIKYFFLNKFS